MKKNKYASRLAAAVLAASMLAGCGGKQAEETPMAVSEPDKITFAFFCNVLIPTDMDKVEAALNEVTREKINVEVKLVPMSMSTYMQQINLMISGGEKLDLFNMFGSEFAVAVAQNKLAAMEPELLNGEAKGATEALGDYIKGATVNGSVYGFPVLKDMANVRGVSMNKDILEKHGLLEEAEKVKSPDELAGLFDKLMTLEPDMVPVCAQNNGTSIMDSGFATYDSLGDRFGVLMDYGQGELKVENLYETQWYEDTVNYIHDWYEKGYILKDSSVNPDTGMPLYKSGKVFANMCDYHIATAPVIENMSGIPTQGAWLADPLTTTTSMNGVVMAIPVTCKDQTPVMKFLNLMYTDPEVINIIDWGVEGDHYVHVDGTKNIITYPEGVTSDNTGYGMNCGWEFGNQLISYVWENTGEDDYYDKMAEFNNSSKKSKACGFSFDSGAVKTEIAALNNVTNEYRFGLENGEMDPDVYLPKFRQALKEAGIEKVIAEKQAQLDAWAAAQ